MLPYNLPTIQLRKNGKTVTFAILTYDLTNHQIIVREPEDNKDNICDKFSVKSGDRHFYDWCLNNRAYRYMTIPITDENLLALEEWLERHRDHRSARRLRAMFPKLFYQNPGWLLRCVVRFLERFP